jgi:pullulanase
MYEQFGAQVDQIAKTVTFKLFFPDDRKAPNQYEGGGLPRIRDVSVVGTFQNPAWDTSHPITMTRTDYSDPVDRLMKGFLYSSEAIHLPDGFYEYKYIVHFENAELRWVSDPCARWGGTENQNSGFVVGGHIITEVQPLPFPRLPLSDLIIYELMIDDFTAKDKQPDESPLQAVIRKLDDLEALGINAIEFMPWTAWQYANDAEHDFSWGYNPVQYFAVAHKYTFNPSAETDKLVYLKQLINECHARNIHVIMDGVFNHADAGSVGRGFPYYWLYEDPADSPYVGNFAEAAYFQDLDYANRCTLEYIRDACIYWIDQFRIDGIRFDNAAGLYRVGDRGHGLPKLLSELRAHLSATGNRNFALILEHSWDYGAIHATNQVGATSCWLDPYRSYSMNYLGDRPQGIPQIEPSIMRMLNSSRDFGPGRVPTIYIENHDHRRFMLKAGGRAYWFLTQPYFIALFTCSGATLIYNGQEFGMENDMPEQGLFRVIPRPLEWNLRTSEPGPTIWARYHQLIEIRRDYPGLRSSNFHPNMWDDGRTQPDADGYGIDRARNVVIYHRWGDDGTGHLERFYVALNFSAQNNVPISFRVPDPGPWQDLLSGRVLDAPNNWLSDGLASNWGAIYYRKY